MTIVSFNTENVVITNDFEPIPVGTYHAVLMDATTKESKSGHKMLSFKWQIVEGPAKNRLLWANMNYFHPDKKTKSIADQQLYRLCSAVGFSGTLMDTGELVGKHCGLVVIIKEGTGGYGPRNEIKSYVPYGSCDGNPTPSTVSSTSSFIPAPPAPTPVNVPPAEDPLANYWGSKTIKL
jgi:hypothetical protein